MAVIVFYSEHSTCNTNYLWYLKTDLAPVAANTLTDVRVFTQAIREATEFPWLQNNTLQKSFIIYGFKKFKFYVNASKTSYGITFSICLNSCPVSPIMPVYLYAILKPLIMLTVYKGKTKTNS